MEPCLSTGSCEAVLWVLEETGVRARPASSGL